MIFSWGGGGLLRKIWSGVKSGPGDHFWHAKTCPAVPKPVLLLVGGNLHLMSGLIKVSVLLPSKATDSYRLAQVSSKV